MPALMHVNQRIKDFLEKKITTGNLGPHQPEGWVDKQKTELQTNYRLLVSTLNSLEKHSMKIF